MGVKASVINTLQYNFINPFEISTNQFLIGVERDVSTLCYQFKYLRVKFE